MSDNAKIKKYTDAGIQFLIKGSILSQFAVDGAVMIKI